MRPIVTNDLGAVPGNIRLQLWRHNLPTTPENGQAINPDKIPHTMNIRTSSSLLLLMLSLSAGSAWSDERWRELAPEERREMRQQMREHWQRENTGPQRLYNNDNSPHRRDLSPDERRRLREEMREQQGREPYGQDERRNRRHRRDE